MNNSGYPFSAGGAPYTDEQWKWLGNPLWWRMRHWKESPYYQAAKKKEKT